LICTKNGKPKLTLAAIITDTIMTKELTKDIIQWDIKSWSKAISYWDSKIDWNKINNGLELGGREGGLSLWLALKGKTIVCSDLNDVQKTAEQLHIRHNVSSLVIYEDIDATNIPYENYFDIIVFKSIIGGIGRNDNYEIQQIVFKEIYKALKPGGKLLFAENLIASSLHKRLRKRFVDWGSSWRYVSLTEMKDFLKDYSYTDIKTTGVLGTFGRNENQRNLLSTIDELILNKICPDNWKYIIYGIAEK
jgi:SAM-dependent methyltransferase